MSELLHFINNHIHYSHEDWAPIAQKLKNKNYSYEEIHAVLGVALEKRVKPKFIKDLFNSYIKENSHNPDLFKWACAYSDLSVVKFLERKMVVKDEYSSVCAAINCSRVDILRFLLEREYDIYIESHFVNAMAKSHISKRHELVAFFTDNLYKVKNLSSFSLKIAPKYEDYFLKYNGIELEKIIKLELLRRKIESNMVSIPLTEPKNQFKI